MKYQAVIFDLDGTLLDTLADIGHTGNAVLKDHGYPTHPIDAYRLFVGEGVRRLVEQILPESARTAELIDVCVREFLDIYARDWHVHTQPFDGIAEMLDELTQRDVQMSVLSNKPHQFTVQCVDQFLAKWKFTPVIGQSDEILCKPDPAGALEIIKVLGIPAENFLYVGDTGTDMQTAVNARLYPVGITWGFRDADELLANGARSVIDHPRELIALLG